MLLSVRLCYTALNLNGDKKRQRKTFIFQMKNNAKWAIQEDGAWRICKNGKMYELKRATKHNPVGWPGRTHGIKLTTRSLDDARRDTEVLNVDNYEKAAKDKRRGSA